MGSTKKRDKEKRKGSTKSKDSKKKKRKRDKHSKDEKKKKKQLKEAKKILALAEEAKKDGRELELITKDDYYNKSLEFRVWLRKEKNKFVEELKTKKAKSYFKKFVDKWNSQKLDASYYNGIDRSSYEALGSRTRHQWGFKVDGKEQSVLDQCRDTVDTETYSTNRQMFQTGPPTRSRGIAATKPGKGDTKTGKRDAPEENDAERRERIYQDRKRQKVETKQWNRHKKEVMEELVPKADPGSFSARADKRRQKGAYTRQQKGGNSPEMRHEDLMGSSSSDFHQMVDKRKKRRDRRNEHLAGKLAVHNEKEAGIMSGMRALMEANKHKYNS